MDARIAARRRPDELLAGSLKSLWTPPIFQGNMDPMIERLAHLRHVNDLLRAFPVVALVGARQVGKTTLARQLAATRKDPLAHFDLEDPDDRHRLADPSLALRELRGLVILDEVQHAPELFSLLRVLADRKPLPARFLVLGSASGDLLRQTSESLAGRIAYHQLDGLALDEVGANRLSRLWLFGGLPRSFLAGSPAASFEWRRQFIRTFLERDLPQLGSTVSSVTLRRFWQMLAHYHGQTWNASEFARSFGVADTTVRRYLDLLTATFVVRQLPAWSENIGKRQVKAPKVYLADSGLLHSLLGIETAHQLEGHPKVGASWEGFALTAVVQRLAARAEECFCWATHTGAALDLLVIRGRERLGFEFKRASAVSATRSMHVALHDLHLSRLDVVHAGRDSYPIGRKLRAVAVSRLLRDL